jgi:hypothetical protein
MSILPWLWAAIEELIGNPNPVYGGTCTAQMITGGTAKVRATTGGDCNIRSITEGRAMIHES